MLRFSVYYNPTNMNELLEKAAMICLTMHSGQTDKAGKAYFLHPMRVAMTCNTDEQRIVAMLHDTIEDTGTTPEDLLEHGFPQEIVDAVVSVSRRDDETYGQFVERCALNPIGRQVKLRDLEDNMDLLRLESIDGRMAARFNRYLKAYRFLTDYIQSHSGQSKSEKAESRTNSAVKVTVVSAEEFARLKAAGAESTPERIVPYDHNAYTGKAYNKEKPQVRMPDGTIVCEKDGIGTLVKVLSIIGITKVAALGLAYGKYPLISDENINGKYTKVQGHWLLNNFPNVHKVNIINEIAEKLHISMKAVSVPKF